MGANFYRTLLWNIGGCDRPEPRVSHTIPMLTLIRKINVPIMDIEDMNTKLSL